MPGRSDEAVEAFRHGYSAVRLAWLLGYQKSDLDAWKEVYVRINLVDRYQTGPYPYDAAVSLADKLLLAQEARIAPWRRCTFLLCGHKVRATFRASDLKPFEERQRKNVTLVSVPHPSGKNRWWNDEQNVATALSQMRKYRR